MNPDRLERMELCLRRLVTEESLEAVPAAIEEYVGEAARQARAFAADDPRIPDLRERVRSLLGWIRTMVESARAYAAADLERLPCLGAYASSAPREHRTDFSA